MNKKQKELLSLIAWDIGCVIPKGKDNKYHYNLAIGNLMDLMRQLKIKEHGE